MKTEMDDPENETRYDTWPVCIRKERREKFQNIPLRLLNSLKKKHERFKPEGPHTYIQIPMEDKGCSLCMKTLGIDGLWMRKAAWIEVNRGQAVLTLSGVFNWRDFALPSWDNFYTCYSFSKLLWWNIVNSYYTGMPDSMQLGAGSSLWLIEDRAEWLVCTDIQRSRRAVHPLSSPVFPATYFDPQMCPFCLCRRPSFWQRTPITNTHKHTHTNKHTVACLDACVDNLSNDKLSNSLVCSQILEVLFHSSYYSDRSWKCTCVFNVWRKEPSVVPNLFSFQAKINNIVKCVIKLIQKNSDS